MTALEIYEKYKHLDTVLSDGAWCEGSSGWEFAHVLWMDIKTAAEDR